jgi:DNA-binding response OmpR family regulator
MPVSRVLVIEDDSGLRTLVEQYLQAEGYEVVGAADGEEGLRYALGDDFDLVICDLILPKISGQQVCDELIRERPQMAKRVVVATGDVTGEETKAFLKRTGLPHLAKPFGLREFAEMVHERLPDC